MAIFRTRGIGVNMKKDKIVVLGAGIAGLSTSYYLQQLGLKACVYEKENFYGGLCNSFEIDGYRFDTFAHLTFSKNPIVNEMLEKKTEYITHAPEALNYYKGKWVRNPVQNNLYCLDLQEKIDIIKGFINRPVEGEIHNYDDWLKTQYGEYFATHFPAKYTRKYWTVEPEQLENKWVEGRMYVPTIDEILKGALSEDTPNVHYTKEMHYPKIGGYKEFLRPMAEVSDITLNKQVQKIEATEKIITFSDGEQINYEYLISTVPLTELPNIICNMPSHIVQCCNELDYTSGIIISLGFNKEDVPKSLWFYIYDEDIYPARVYSPSVKSPNNVPPQCSSIQAEIYFSKYKPLVESPAAIANKTVEQLINMGVFCREDLVVQDVRVKKYANIMFTPKIYQNRKKVHEYLKQLGIMVAGRFGEWDYLWTDQSLLSGRKAALEVVKKIREQQ